MSNLVARVSSIKSCDTLNIVTFECSSQTLTMMSLDLSKDIKVDAKVSLVIKASHVGIAKEFSGEVSCSNQLKCTIESVENGELLSSLKLRFSDITIESIITLDSSKRMNLKVGDEVLAFVKASELSIGKIIHD